MTLDDRTAQSENPFNDPALAGLVGGKIEQLRVRLLDFSRRNPLVHVAFRSNSSSLIRVVDELPDMLRLNLESEGEMRLVPLPPIEVDPRDELSNTFLDALFLARREDEEYLRATENLDPDDTKAIDKERQLERELKDRLRERLGLPKRLHKDAVSLVDHARANGIDPSYDLPHPGELHDDGRHSDDGIQTLLTPDRLRRAGKTILTRGRAVEREIGVNVQHAVFGLLEWRNPDEKETYLSPLILMEVRFDRRSAVTGEQHWVAGGSSPLVNTTLREKLLSEYRLELPEYQGGSIETYFDQVRDKAPLGWDWRVRRQVVFGIFPSSRMAMYHDLDPAKRPLGQKELITRLLASAGASGSSVYAEDYEPDSTYIDDVVPYVVRDADASQWSALVDVLRGKNVAIEGPPGSGKSQTIVNIVAASLAAGKRVLFVAEKLTALDVVKNRIEAAGLGEFILALQAGKSSSDQVYASIEERLELANTSKDLSSTQFKLRLEQLERRKDQMQAYLNVLSASFGGSGMTVHEMLGRSVRTAEVREKLPRDIRRSTVAGVALLSKANLEQIISDAHAFAKSLSQGRHIPALWMQAEANVVTREDAEDLSEEAAQLVRLTDKLKILFETAGLVSLGKDAWKALDLVAALPLLDLLADLLGSVGGQSMSFLIEEQNRVLAESFADKSEKLRQTQEVLSSHLRHPASAWQTIQVARVTAEANGGSIDISRAQRQLQQQKDSLAAVEGALEIFGSLNANWGRSGIGIEQLRELTAVLRETPAHILSLKAMGNIAEVELSIATFEAARHSVSEKYSKLKEALPRIGDHSIEAVLSSAEMIEGGGFFASFSQSYRNAVDFFRRDLGGSADANKATMVRQLRAYGKLIGEKNALNSHEMVGRFGPGFKGYDTDPKFLLTCRDYVARVNRTLRDWPTLCSEIFAGHISSLLRLRIDSSVPDVTFEEAQRELHRRRDAVAVGTKRVSEMRSLLTAFSKGGTITLKSLNELAILMEEAKILLDDLSQDYAILPQGLVKNPEKVGQAVSVAVEMTERLGIKASQLMLDESDKTVTAQLVHDAAVLQRDIVLASSSFAKNAGLRNFPDTLTALDAIRNELAEASESPYGLLDRAIIKRAEARLRAAGLDEMVNWALNGDQSFDVNEFPAQVDAVLAKNLADAAYDRYGTTLRGYSGLELNEIRQDIASKDRDVIELTRQVVRAKVISAARPPDGTGVGKKSDFTEMSLIRNELGKRKRRVAIRELTRRSWRALLEIKPCWMMSPLAVSQFLLPQAHFDLVIIDEASQMTPENALGAISRASQVVIVGDTKQLPPTSFFSRMIDDSDVDDDLREDAESILELANLAFTPMRQLRWHYRSQHADLIRFSNHWMYDGKLTIFPSAENSHANLGVELVRVDGTYVGQVNVAEARKVVEAAVRLMEETPEISLGICSMNTKQRDLIEEEMDRERQRNPHVQAYIARWEGEGDGLESFFVKNLEAIQGDERDVMFISTLYGPESLGGKTHQRFGPINTAQGHRRLNVLFSRAKKKIVTFTSMDPTDILVDEGKSKGVQMLRNWLEYCKTGNLGEPLGANGGFESPFEEHVASVVEGLGYEVVPQVGTAGYRVDLGVRHPDWVHGFIAGIECDGATYHSSKSARDRDRLREEILTRLGWNLHRIWSTDWFTNPQMERDRIKTFLADRLATLKALPERKLVSSFNDILSRPVRPMAVQPPANTFVPRPEAVSPSKSKQADIFKHVTASPNSVGSAVAVDPGKRVRVGCSVTIMQNGEERSYKISASENDPHKGVLRKDVPLAEAMLDLEEGDEFEFALGVNVRNGRIIKIH